MAAINFPDSPTDGEEYTASNGVVYKYNASTDTWTGQVGTGEGVWTQDGTLIYPTDITSKVGIGTQTPSVDLDVDGEIKVKTYNLVSLDSLPE